jgi:UDP-glucose 4-epimerase
MNKKKKAVVTGGCGFIGSHIVDFLLNEGWRVSVVDNLSSGKIDNLKHCLSNVEITIADVRDEQALFKVFN